jgi:predicted tellurium resistance membrane protein TerC
MFDFVAIFSEPANLIALATLIVMEVVLGIDNLIFISILTNKLPEHQRAKARFVGISAALVLRLAFLSLVFVIVQLTEPVFTVFGQGLSWRDMILISGGLFLVYTFFARSSPIVETSLMDGSPLAVPKQQPQFGT